MTESRISHPQIDLTFTLPLEKHICPAVRSMLGMGVGAGVSGAGGGATFEWFSGSERLRNAIAARK